MQSQTSNVDKQPTTTKSLTGFQLHPENINREGRPKRKTLTELIHAKLDNDPDSWEKIAALVITKILTDKNDKILQTFWEYTDGKPKQTIDLNDASEEIRKAKEYVDNQIRSMGGDVSQEHDGGEVQADSGATEDL